MFPSRSDEVDPTGATSSSVGSTDSPRTLQRYARLALAALLACLAWIAFRDELGYVPLLSDIDLAIHEFGHMLFMPFGIQFLGETMVILGGSLTQVAFPLVFFGYFWWKQDDGRRRDLFAAMVCLWWSGINLLSVAIYCADSRAGQLMLLDGSRGGCARSPSLCAWGVSSSQFGARYNNRARNPSRPRCPDSTLRVSIFISILNGEARSSSEQRPHSSSWGPAPATYDSFSRR